jgi:hypothetical protein
MTYSSTRRTPSSGMLRRMALVSTEVSEEHITSIIRVTRIGELGTTLAVISVRSTQPDDGGDVTECYRHPL